MRTAAANAWLVDERWFKAYPLADETTIGRAPDCTVILRDPAVSRHHAQITRETSGYVLHALGSAGVQVNGTPVTATRALQEGDVVEIAFTTLRFTLRAPTNEMLVIPRDTPTPTDSVEGPTRATLRALKRSDIMRGARRYWRKAGIAALIIAMLLLLLATL